MASLDTAWNRPPGRGEGRWRRFSASLPMRTALLAVASVWILGCVWSYQEQSAFAASKGFTFPHLLPLVIDGFAVSMAGVAWAASLDARPAFPARLATLIAVAGSSASNGVWAYLRAHHDMVTVVLGMTVPVAANLAFEVLLAELRRQVQRRRGLPPPVAVPYPRMIRIVLAPWQTFGAWRTLVLEITTIDHTVVRANPRVPPAQHAARPAQRDPARGEPLAARMVNEAIETTQVRAIPRTDRAAGETVPNEPAFLAPAPHSLADATHAPDGEAMDSDIGAPSTDQTASTHAPPLKSRVPASSLVPASSPDAEPVDAPGLPQHDRHSRTATTDNESRPPENTTRDPSAVNDRRVVDPRVARLAECLFASRHPDEVTGEMVGPMLDMDVAPRTGRRLLGQARALLGQVRRVELDDADESVANLDRYSGAATVITSG